MLWSCFTSLRWRTVYVPFSWLIANVLGDQRYPSWCFSVHYSNQVWYREKHEQGFRKEEVVCGKIEISNSKFVPTLWKSRSLTFLVFFSCCTFLITKFRPFFHARQNVTFIIFSSLIWSLLLFCSPRTFFMHSSFIWARRSQIINLK